MPFFFILLLLSGCASSFLDRDQGNPLYHQGGGTVFIPVLPTQTTFVGRDFQPTNARLSDRRSMTPEELAITGVVASGVTLAMNKDYYQSSYISGRCRCTASREPDFEIPCGTVTVVLEDRQGNKLSTITSEDGEFVFPVEKGKDYVVKASSAFYASSPKRTFLKMGDSIILPLNEKLAKTGE